MKYENIKKKVNSVYFIKSFPLAPQRYARLVTSRCFQVLLLRLAVFLKHCFLALHIVLKCRFDSKRLVALLSNCKIHYALALQIEILSFVFYTSQCFKRVLFRIGWQFGLEFSEQKLRCRFTLGPQT